jgi:hypothetical protein
MNRTPTHCSSPKPQVPKPQGHRSRLPIVTKQSKRGRGHHELRGRNVTDTVRLGCARVDHSGLLRNNPYREAPRHPSPRESRTQTCLNREVRPLGAAFTTQIPSDPAALNNGGYFVPKPPRLSLKLPSQLALPALGLGVIVPWKLGPCRTIPKYLGIGPSEKGQSLNFPGAFLLPVL